MQARLAKARMLSSLQANSNKAAGLDDLDMIDFEEEEPPNQEKVPSPVEDPA